MQDMKMYLKSFNSKQLFLSECKLESKLNILFWLTNAMLTPRKQNDRYRRSSIKEKGIYEKINKTILLLNYDSSPFLPLANRFQQHNLSIFFLSSVLLRERKIDDSRYHRRWQRVMDFKTAYQAIMEANVSSAYSLFT